MLRGGIVACLVLVLAGSAADVGATPPPLLVALARTPDAPTGRALRASGATLVERDLRIWRIPGPAAARLVPRLGVRRLEQDSPLLPLAGSATTTVTPRSEWWLRAIGAGKLVPPPEGKPVSVIDTGADVEHQELVGHDVVLLNKQEGLELPGDYHGTAVSSLVAGKGVRVLGVDPHAVLREWDATPDGPLTLSAIIAGIDAAIRAGPSVINLSLGGPVDDPLLRETVLDAVHRGSLVVAAQGEDRFDGSPPVYPADDPHVLTVVATDRHNVVYIDSNGSEANDLSAPGVEMSVAVPVTGTDPTGYRTVTGNSFAAAVVSGAAAWLWTRRPSLTPAQLYGLLVSTARRISNGPYNTVSGYGLLNLEAALAAPVPPASPYEPNDDIAQVEPGRLFANGAPLLTSPSRSDSFVRGGLYANQNPRDVYRVWIPPHGHVTATASVLGGRIDVRAWRAGTRSVLEGGASRRRDLVAEGTRLELSNPAGRPVVAYVEVSLGDSQTAAYSLSLQSRL